MALSADRSVCTCERCGHSWTPRLRYGAGSNHLPKQCPNCNSKTWNVPGLGPKAPRPRPVRGPDRRRLRAAHFLRLPTVRELAASGDDQTFLLAYQDYCHALDPHTVSGLEHGPLPPQLASNWDAARRVLRLYFAAVGAFACPSAAPAERVIRDEQQPGA